MQPIHYSLIFNFLALMLTGFMAWEFEEPLLVIITLLVAQHTMARFSDNDDDDDDEPGIGFMADVK